jgi:hypothetical protein
MNLKKEKLKWLEKENLGRQKMNINLMESAGPREREEAAGRGGQGRRGECQC